jgi:hypothetical protein
MSHVRNVCRCEQKWEGQKKKTLIFFFFFSRGVSIWFFTRKTAKYDEKEQKMQELFEYVEFM